LVLKWKNHFLKIYCNIPTYASRLVKIPALRVIKRGPKGLLGNSFLLRLLGTDEAP